MKLRFFYHICETDKKGTETYIRMLFLSHLPCWHCLEVLHVCYYINVRSSVNMRRYTYRHG
jgi:hypothetical protein